MLRHLGQPLERDPQTIHPRKGEVDPEDSVFVIYLHPRTTKDTAHEGEPQMPVIASIWLSLQDARTIADRYVQNGDPFNTNNEFEGVSVVEYATNTPGAASSERHHYRAFPVPPTILPDAPSARLEQLEIELAELRAKMGIGVQGTTFAPQP